MSDDARSGANLSADVGLTYRDFARHIPPAVWVEGVPWQLYGRVLMPMSMPHVPVEVDRARLRDALAEQRALVACWTSDWDLPRPTEWWWTCCDRQAYDVEQLASAKRRRDIRKGLRECTIRRVPTDEFTELAYPV